MEFDVVCSNWISLEALPSLCLVLGLCIFVVVTFGKAFSHYTFLSRERFSHLCTCLVDRHYRLFGMSNEYLTETVGMRNS